MVLAPSFELVGMRVYTEYDLKRVNMQQDNNNNNDDDVMVC